MPKTAFWKLPFDKRNHFIETSVREFSNQSYENVSVKYISEQTGISKGTLYKYFENKKDLYLYLVDFAITKKYETIDRLLRQTPKDDFPEILYQIYLHNTQFEVKFPIFSRFLYCVYHEHPHHELGNLPQMLKKQASNQYRAMLHAQQQEGNIRSDIPLEILTYLVVELNWGIRDYFLTYHPKLFNNQLLGQVATEKLIRDFASQLTQVVNEGFIKNEVA